MSSSFLLLFIILIALAGLLIIAVAFHAIKKKNEQVSEDAIFLTSRKVHYDFWFNMYSTLNSIVFTKTLVNRLYRQYEILNPGNEKEVKEKAVQTTVVLFGLNFAVIFGVLLLKPTLFKIVCALWFLYNATNLLVDRSLLKQEAELHKEFSKFISEVRRNYFKYRMVDEAIYETYDKLSKMMQGHAILIYNTLTAKDPVEGLHKYSTCAPNSYMKQFVSICAITMKYGDKVVNGQSLFLADIKDLKQTMDTAMLQKASVKDKFRFLDVIIMIPLFTMDFIKNWGISVFPTLQKFYDGKNGILLILGALVVSIVLMMILNHLKNGKQIDRSEHPMLEFLLSFKPIKRFVRNYEENYFSKTYKLRMLLKRTGSSYTSELILLRRLIGGAVAFVGALVLLVSLNIAQVNLTVNDVREMADKGSGTTDYANVAIMALTDYHMREYLHYDLVDLYNTEVAPNAGVRSLDESCVENLKMWFADKFTNEGVDISDEDFLRVVRSYNSSHSAETSLMTIYYGTTDAPSGIEGLDELTLRKIDRDTSRIKELITTPNGLREQYLYELIAEGVYTHVKDYQDAAFKWYYFVIAILTAVLFYQMPVLVLKINERELQDFMEDEVIQFHSIIMILMYIDQMTVETILTEMEMFAFCFKDSIQKCLNHLASGEEAALEQLMADEPFEPFARLVENLISCDRIGVQQAFNEIDIERQNYIERRKQEGEVKLSNRSATAQFLAYIPLYFIVGLYMVWPFIVESMSSLTDTMASM